MTIMAYLENIVIVVCASLLCWYFENGWFLLMLLFCNSVVKSGGDE